jgi:asparaginyl-tRNA synthetase
MTLEFLREKIHLRTRTNTIASVSRIRNCLAFATHRFFQESGFLYVHAPLITQSDCEGAGEMFQVSARGALSACGSAGPLAAAQPWGSAGPLAALSLDLEQTARSAL